MFVADSEIESEAASTDFAGADIYGQHVVKPSWRSEVELGIDDNIFEFPDGAISFCEIQVPEVLDPTDLEVRKVVAMEYDSHRIGFG